MGVDYQVSQIYDAAMNQVTASEEAWKSVCSMIGQLYRYEFDNILMVYMQRPRASLVADFDTWKKVGRYVRRGSKGIAIFPSRALNPHMRYVFDISDTGGKKVKLTWELNHENMEAYAKFLKEKEGIAEVEISVPDMVQEESPEHFLKDFTEQQIGVIMNTEFGDRVTELVGLAGKKRIKVDDETQEITAEEALKRSIMYAVFTRCGFDLSPEKQDFSFITAYQKEEEIYRLGSLVSDISCEVLRNIAKSITQMERSIAYGRDNNNISRGSGRNALSQSDVAGGNGIHDEFRQVRSTGNGILKGESQGALPEPDEVWQAGREDAGSGRRSEPDDGDAGSRLPEKESTERPEIHNGNVGITATGEDAGRGNRDDRDRDEISLEEKESDQTNPELNTEIEKELSELDSYGKGKEGSYEQASFFDTQNEELNLPKQYTYVKPKQELVIPHEYVTETLLRGSGFSGGRKRIYEMFEKISDPEQRAKAIKKEYGIGGASWPIDGYGLHGYDTLGSRGLRLQWKDKEGKKEGYLNWRAVEREISVLILTGDYYQLPKEYDAEKVNVALWQEPMDEFFRECFWSPVPNVMLYEIFTKDIPFSDKVEFMESLFRLERWDVSIGNHFYNKYGTCNIERSNAGLSIEFYDEKEIKWKTELDWWECASYLDHMIKDKSFQPKFDFQDTESLERERNRAGWIASIWREGFDFLSQSPGERQEDRVSNLNRILEQLKLSEIEVAWDEAYDEIIAADGESTWNGRQFYDFLLNEIIVTDEKGNCESIGRNTLRRLKREAVSSHNPDKTKLIRRVDIQKAEMAAEQISKKEEVLWLEPLKQYFNGEIQYVAVKVLLYDIFTTNLSVESKAEFLASVYGEERKEFFLPEAVENAYGSCQITRDKEGITITYPKADNTQGKQGVDYYYCTCLILHMIERNVYLSEATLARFQESPKAFTAMPWFMEIYSEYKERMREEESFEAIELPVQELESEPERKIALKTAVEHAEGDILDQTGRVIKPATQATFPKALQQVEAMAEDLRDAVELYVTGCSSIKPYQPFLCKVWKSSLSTPDKLSFFIRTVNHLGKEESKAYYNNAYGLVECHQSQLALMFDYKDQAGKRHKEEVSFEQVYSVMEYLIRTEAFVEKGHLDHFEKMWAETPHDKKNPLYQDFENRLSVLTMTEQGGNFRFEGKELLKGGAKTRFHWNVEAIRLLKQIEYEERCATKEEQELLSRYVGWGGISQTFDEKNENWNKEYEELKNLLFKTEYEDARESVNTAFYTAPVITKAVYAALQQLGFQKGSILEPALGVGHFFGTLPESLSGCKLYGIEKDDISGRIAKLLYPKAEIKIRGFEETQYPDNFFDVSVGNVPFGDYKLYDPKYAKQNFRIHDYFFGAQR